MPTSRHTYHHIAQCLGCLCVADSLLCAGVHLPSRGSGVPITPTTQAGSSRALRQGVPLLGLMVLAPAKPLTWPQWVLVGPCDHYHQEFEQVPKIPVLFLQECYGGTLHCWRGALGRLLAWGAPSFIFLLATELSLFPIFISSVLLPPLSSLVSVLDQE